MTVKNYSSWAQDGPLVMHKRKLQIFPVAGLLKFSAIPVLVALPNQMVTNN